VIELPLARVVEERDLGGLAAPAPVRRDWTAIIPAAGRGQRLGFDKPKVLYPVAGRTILEWLLDEVEPLCERIVFVLSPAGAPLVIPELDRLIPGRWAATVQNEPAGMGDAVLTAKDAVRTPCSLVVWGDQIGVRSATIRLCMSAQGLRSNAVATCPTVLRERPYIHFQRDATGRLLSILQAREGDVLPERGESDCGVFLFRTQPLFDTLHRMQTWPGAWGRQTKEFNLLPIFPLLDHEPGNVCCVRIQDAGESVGINTVTDAETAKGALLARLGQA
jgi:bifunctional N-acetylglucosamine-1-phosphate-uridyltransferase/glucosamine-1-phosphate-acetyltransferase GlmU-like protein